MKRCCEIVVYTIKEGMEHEFEATYALLQKELSALAGFVSSEKLQSIKEPRMFTDMWVWETVEHALEAHRRYASLSHAKPFQALIESVLHSGTYT